MKIQNVDPAKLTPADYNPRTISEHQAEALKRSLDRWGFVEPIVANKRTGRIVGGHQRLDGALALALPSVPVHWIDVDESSEKALNIALNKISGDWDEDLLGKLLADLERDGQDLEDLGFDADELQEIIDAAAPEPELSGDLDEVPEPPAEPITQPGDLWQLGEHRLLCGDSTNAEDVARLMGEHQPDIVFTDPPYSSGGFQESGKTSGSIGARGGVKIENDNLSTRGFLALMDRVLANLRQAHTLFVFCDWKMWAHNCDVVEAKGYRVRNMLVWDKIQMGMGMPFRNQHELCVFASKIAGKIGDGKTANVLSYPRDRQAEHATPKPVALICEMLNQVPGDLIVDPFVGGGSTIIAAEQTGRKCYAMELSPAYCDVAVKRWEQATGRKAERIG